MLNRLCYVFPTLRETIALPFLVAKNLLSTFTRMLPKSGRFLTNVLKITQGGVVKVKRVTDEQNEKKPKNNTNKLTSVVN